MMLSSDSLVSPGVKVDGVIHSSRSPTKLPEDLIKSDTPKKGKFGTMRPKKPSTGIFQPGESEGKPNRFSSRRPRSAAFEAAEVFSSPPTKKKAGNDEGTDDSVTLRDLQGSFSLESTLTGEDKKGPRSHLLESVPENLIIHTPEGFCSINWDRVQHLTLGNVLSEIATALKYTEEHREARDKNNHVLDVQLVVSEVVVDGNQISYSVDPLDWENLSKTEVYSDAAQQQPPPAPVMAEVLQEMAQAGVVLINLTLPDKACSKFIYLPNKPLKELCATAVANRQLKIEELVPKDIEGNSLDWHCPAVELNLKSFDIFLITKVEDAEPFTIYFPGGLRRSSPPWDPKKELKAELKLFFEAKPELQSLPPISVTTDQPYTNLNIKLGTIQERAICVGITKKEWVERYGSAPKKKINRASSIKTRTTSKIKLPKAVSTEETKKLSSTTFYLYLPGEIKKSYPIDKEKDTELGEILDKVVKSYQLTPTPEWKPRDGNDNEIDLKTKVRDLNITEIAYGITLKEWTVHYATEAIENYIRRETTTDVNSQKFQVYLPQGQITAMVFEPNTKLVHILQRVRQKRTTQNLTSAVATDLKGNELDTNKTLDELGLKEICYGVSIIDWIEDREKEKLRDKGIEDLEASTLTSSTKLRFGYLFDLEKQAPSPAKDHKESARKRVPKSPHRKTPSKTASTHKFGTDYSEIVQCLNNKKQTVDEIQIEAQLSSFWFMQNSASHDDENLFEQYCKEEPVYKSTFMVPFPFLSAVPHRRKAWEPLPQKELEEWERHVTTKCLNLKKEEEDEDKYIEWHRRMEASMYEKRKEDHQSVTVGLI
eukprot:TRINITY_DN4031_c0_g2_i1.p1 TRINITY_DN4031_c0_g2~~TRINITY_DN4031_c0_g2_i1.p1  ORF type:complete len:825 (+),score=204.64 TRINITY_DN4031_c0_g2_i1:329-2803(+)